MMDFKNESSLKLQYSLSDQLHSYKTYAQSTFFLGDVPQKPMFFFKASKRVTRKNGEILEGGNQIFLDLICH